ncbi:MAG: hypothetical protein RLZZ546_412 [Bacteroidota bacterium]|jgi:hypothetical protein
MAGLIISPLRGLMNFWYALSYNHNIPSGFNIKNESILSKAITEQLKKNRRDDKIIENILINEYEPRRGDI